MVSEQRSVFGSIRILADTTSNISSFVKGTFRIKLFIIVGVTTFILGLGLGLTAGIYYGYKKWTSKIDKIIEQSKHGVLENIKEKIKTKL